MKILWYITPSQGTIRYGDTEITSLGAAKTAQLGITIVPEERQIFPQLTVRENAEVSHIGKGDRDGWDIDEALSIFENLGTKGDQLGSTLSGGEQQMLAISRALVFGPEILILDEHTEGLAPQIVTEVAEIISNLKSQGLTILLVEQNVEVAVDLADRVYALDRGKIVFEGTAAEFESNEEIKKQHLGVSK